MEDRQALRGKATLSLHEAARLMAGDGAAVREVEGALAHAIESGALAADVVRWATEQWDGERLEGNIDRMRTHVERRDLETWLAGQGRHL
mgnify:CR=1 FL=1